MNTSEIRRKERRAQWAGRYNDRLPNSTLRNQPYEEGQEAGSSIDLASDENSLRQRPNGSGEFWSRNEERYYSQNGDSTSVRTVGSGGRWHYPANFEDAMPTVKSKKSRKKKKEKKDRWARTEDAYSIGEGSSSKRKKTKKNRSTVGDSDTYSRNSSTEFPEDPEGALYGEPRRGAEGAQTQGLTEEDIFNHEL